VTDAYIPYPSQVYAQTHPAAIGAIATLHGRKVPPFDASRVLDIGCGEGVNLMAMAIGAPGAEFVGVDIDEPAIANAQTTAAQCDADNVVFHALDLCDIGPDFGDFDYIIAHGVYTWTPDAIRTALMRVIGERLKSHGLAFVSFNALPGARLRQAVRDMLVTVTNGVVDPPEKLEIARAFLAEQIEAWSSTEADESALKSVAKGIFRKAPEVLYHDELAPGYAPEMLSQVIARAKAFGLSYLCDVEPNVSAEAFFPTDAFAPLRARSGGDWARFEQLADFRNLRPFRNAIFARGGAPDPRRDAARLRGLWASAELKIESADPNAPEGAAFVSSGGAKLRTNNPALAGFLTRLAEAFPLALPLDGTPDLDALADHIYQLIVTQVVRIVTTPQPFVARSGDRPKANALARVQAERGEIQLATLRPAMIRIDEPRMLAFVPLMDGSRTRVELVQEFGRLLAVAQDEAERRLDESLTELGRRGLMVG
jgi:SAM-dependent methyltransferase